MKKNSVETVQFLAVNDSFKVKVGGITSSNGMNANWICLKNSSSYYGVFHWDTLFSWWEILTKRMSEKELELRIGDMKVELAQLWLLQTSLLSAQKYWPNPKTRCESTTWLNEVHRSVSDQSHEWVTCKYCNHWFHYACEGVVTIREIIKTETDSDSYKCLSCKGGSINDLLARNKSKLDLTEKELSSLLAKLAAAKARQTMSTKSSARVRALGTCAQRAERWRACASPASVYWKTCAVCSWETARLG